MENNIIKFEGGDNWLVMDLYRFLHFLNVYYNRLYVFKNYENTIVKPKYIDVKRSLDNSLYQVSKGDELTVIKISLQSPIKFSFEGAGGVVKEIRETYKDFSYRNEQERQKGQIDIAKNSAILKRIEYENELLRTKLIRHKIDLLKEAGFSDDEIRETVKKLIIPANKMLKSSLGNDVKLIE
jgi:hypothetical protein